MYLLEIGKKQVKDGGAVIFKKLNKIVLDIFISLKNNKYTIKPSEVDKNS